MKREPTPEIFLRDVAGHQMSVLLDNGIYRHLKFCAPRDSWNMWFEIVTWPNKLTISGDMGTWTFSRVEDMFTFFRSSREMVINADYWAEKLQNGVHGGTSGAKSYDGDRFASQLLAQLSEYYGFEGEDLKELTEAVDDEVLTDDWVGAVITAARDFEHVFDDGRKFHFDSCELPDGRDYCYHFIWCLYAIVWGIQQWDAARKGVAA